MDIFELTDLELEILQRLAEGQSRNWIPLELGISRATLYRNLESIRQKLRAENNGHAVVIALEKGWVGGKGQAGPAAATLSRSAPPWRKLTKREREIFLLLGDLQTSQQTDRQLAQRLNIAETTLKKHLHHIYGKLGVANRSSAAILAAQ
jgi:DNA-binding CsgD family transcriptional regulator